MLCHLFRRCLVTKSFTRSNSRFTALFPLTRLPKGLLFAIALMFLTSSSLLAQGLGRISGTISDTTGAVIPGATVTVTQVGTGTKTNVKANDQGDYIFPSLPPATYDLSVTASSFAGYVQKGILLQADAAVTQNITLKTGSATETITVSSDALQIDTTTGTVSQVINSSLVNQLPLNGRNAAALTLLATGA